MSVEAEASFVLSQQFADCPMAPVLNIAANNLWCNVFSCFGPQETRLAPGNLRNVQPLPIVRLFSCWASANSEECADCFPLGLSTKSRTGSLEPHPSRTIKPSKRCRWKGLQGSK